MGIGRKRLVEAYSHLSHPIPVHSSLSSPLQSIQTNSTLFPNPQSPIPNLQFGMPNLEFYPQLNLCVSSLVSWSLGGWIAKALEVPKGEGSVLAPLFTVSNERVST